MKTVKVCKQLNTVQIRSAIKIIKLFCNVNGYDVLFSWNLNKIQTTDVELSGTVVAIQNSEIHQSQVRGSQGTSAVDHWLIAI